VIDELGRALGHPTAAATGTEGASFTGIRHEPVEVAVPTAKPREPAGEPATRQKVPELLLHEAGQTFSIAETRGLLAKRFEVIMHDGV
jgi:hypothetical protein